MSFSYFFAINDLSDIRKMNSQQLAYIGDSVWELIVRSYLFGLKKNVHHMHVDCVRLVNAAAQSQALDRIQPLLGPEENDIVQRARNSHAHHSPPKNQNAADYSSATAFEALIGYLFLLRKEEELEKIVKVLLPIQP